MNAATIAIIVQGVAALAPYLAQLGMLAAKAKAGEPVTDGDLQLAEEARRRAFIALRVSLTGPAA
ncbi:MAG: hypothetical protein HYU58_00150 [Proteobacteria bacterium]|nr:hypothetical protein [Pseudomonadota bacterium]